jgi:glutamyl-tRNA synthetase
VAAGESAVVRFKMPVAGVTSAHDLIRGLITWDNSKQQDAVLMKSDGLPTYHLANVVDDHLMEISHILRAEEWIPSVPLHVQLYRAFVWQIPAYAHLPVMLNPLGPDGKPVLPGKLSKRKQLPTVAETEDEDTPKTPDYTQVREFREEGYLPEALFNFLALQGAGYSASEEIFTRDQLIELFTLDRVKPSPARLDYKKLDRFNSLYIRSLPVEELARRLRPYLLQAGLEVNTEVLLQVTPLIQERLTQLDEVVSWAGFFFQEEIQVDPADLVGKDLTAEQSRAVLARARETMAGLPSFGHDSLETTLRDLAEELELKAGTLFGMLRQALTGQKVAPPLFGTMIVLGRALTLQRIRQAEEKL